MAEGRDLPGQALEGGFVQFTGLLAAHGAPVVSTQTSRPVDEHVGDVRRDSQRERVEIALR